MFQTKLAELKNITINRILFLFYFLLFTLLVYTGFLIYLSSSRTITEYSDIAKIVTNKLSILIEIRKNTAFIEMTKLNHIITSDQVKMSEEESLIENYHNTNTKLYHDYRMLVSDSVEERMLNEILIYRNVNREIRSRVIKLSGKNKQIAATDLHYKSAVRAFENYQESISKLVSHIENQARFKEKDVSEYVDSYVKMIFYFLTAIVVVLIFFGLIIRHSAKVLNDSNNFSEFLVNSTPDALVGVNDKGEIILFNSQASEIFGYKRNEIIGKHADILMPSRFHPAYKIYLTEYYKKTGIRQIGNYRKFYGLSKDGKEFPVNISLNHSYFWQKSIILCNIRDMTTQNSLELSLKGSERRLNEAQKISQTGSWELDLNTQKVFWSMEQYRMNGIPFSDKQLFQEDFMKQIHPDDIANMTRKMHEALSTGRHEMEFRIVLPDGSIRHMYGIAHVEYDENQKPVKIIGTNQDITDKKKAEEELQIQNLELTKTNAELDRFVYSTSHDLRSPLTSVIALVNFIEEETLEPDTKLHAKMIHSRISQLDDFVKNILDYSRNARLVVTPESIDFNELVQQTLKSLKHAKGAEKIDFKVECRQENAFYSDKQRLVTIFENLIGNAIKYHNYTRDEPFIKVKVSVGKSSTEIQIEDNGIGIEEKHRSKVFDMFYRSSGNVPGSGLGLYLVKEIIEKMEGKISLHSQTNIGTKFIVNIPNLISENES